MNHSNDLTRQWLDSIFALEDNIISFYDVVLETGEYKLYRRDAFLADNAPSMLNNTEFFSDLKRNVEIVVYPEDREGILKALDAGMDEHLAKPIDLARLKSVLTGFLL